MGDRILTAKEFRENTMGCFYQDELREHDKSMRKKIAELEKENARLRKVLNVLNKDKIIEIITKVMDREFTRAGYSEEIALAMIREIGKIQNEGKR